MWGKNTFIEPEAMKEYIDAFLTLRQYMLLVRITGAATIDMPIIKR